MVFMIVTANGPGPFGRCEHFFGVLCCYEYDGSICTGRDQSLLPGICPISELLVNEQK